MVLDIGKIRQDLQQIRTLDQELKIFGAFGHHWRLNPPAKERQVASFEKKYRVRLPENYRTFLIELGNGGAGPYYGIFPLDQDYDGKDLSRGMRQGTLGDPSLPFPHQTDWNLPPSFFAQSPEYQTLTQEEYDRAQEAWNKKLIAEYWPGRFMDGAIPICEVGCALQQYLVVTGPGAGGIWADYRADNRGIRRVLDQNGRPLFFAEWYLQWLESSLKEALANAISVDRREREG